MKYLLFLLLALLPGFSIASTGDDANTDADTTSIDLNDEKSIEEIHRQPPAPKTESSTQGSTELPIAARNALSLELGGHGGLYTLNYDWQFDDMWAFGAGFEYFSGANLYLAEARNLTLLPIYANFYPERGAHSVYLTAGGALAHGEVRGGAIVDLFGGNHKDEAFLSESTFYGFGGLGYQYRPENGPGLLFRATLYLLVPYTLPWVGVSLGYSF